MTNAKLRHLLASAAYALKSTSYHDALAAEIESALDEPLEGCVACAARRAEVMAQPTESAARLALELAETKAELERVRLLAANAVAVAQSDLKRLARVAFDLGSGVRDAEWQMAQHAKLFEKPTVEVAS